jgi:hypothetical protein
VYFNSESKVNLRHFKLTTYSPRNTCIAIVALLMLGTPIVFGQPNELASSNYTRFINQSNDEFWKADLGDVISTLAAIIAGGGLIFTALAFRNQTNETRMRTLENLVKDMQRLEAEQLELFKVPAQDILKHRENLRIRLLNTLELFAFIANRNYSNSKDIICFVKPVIKQAYESLKEEEKSIFTELVKLYNNIQD